MNAYSFADAARILKIPPARLRYWGRAALLETARDANALEFRDLLSLKAVAVLRARGVPLARIRRSVEAVRRHLPEVDRPLAALRLWAEGSGRVVVCHAGVLLEPDGQTVLDFSPGRGALPQVAPLAAARPGGEEACAGPREASALDWFERGCRLDSDRATWAEAALAYERAIELDPGFADAHCNLGSLYFNQRRRAAARRHFERALAIDPRHVESNLNLALLLEEAGRAGSALNHYRIALRSDPLYADTHVSLALLYEKLGLRSRARDHWRRYLQLEPAGAWAAVARRRLD